jgi:hypothetical protein
MRVCSTAARSSPVEADRSAPAQHGTLAQLAAEHPAAPHPRAGAQPQRGVQRRSDRARRARAVLCRRRAGRVLRTGAPAGFERASTPHPPPASTPQPGGAGQGAANGLVGVVCRAHSLRALGEPGDVAGLGQQRGEPPNAGQGGEDVDPWAGLGTRRCPPRRRRAARPARPVSVRWLPMTSRAADGSFRPASQSCPGPLHRPSPRSRPGRRARRGCTVFRRCAQPCHGRRGADEGSWRIVESLLLQLPPQIDER